jgi:hypothetical protein
LTELQRPIHRNTIIAATNGTRRHGNHASQTANIYRGQKRVLTSEEVMGKHPMSRDHHHTKAFGTAA